MSRINYRRPKETTQCHQTSEQLRRFLSTPFKPSKTNHKMANKQHFVQIINQPRVQPSSKPSRCATFTASDKYFKSYSTIVSNCHTRNNIYNQKAFLTQNLTSTVDCNVRLWTKLAGRASTPKIPNIL